MHLKKLKVTNFRALQDVEVDFSEGVNVIVGPNAIGKTTILEAIRLAKALLASRSQNEGNQALLSLGAVTPHDRQRLIPSAIARDPSTPLEIRCTYQFSKSELDALTAGVPQIVTGLVQSRLGGNTNPANLAAFFSSDQGQRALKETEPQVRERLNRTENENNSANLNLKIDFKSGRIDSDDPIGATLISFLDNNEPPNLTKISYFPADRALPRGEQAVQLGHQDANQQLESHNSQPHLKYQRLKNTIFSAIVMNEKGRATLSEDFKTIFSGVLKGKELVGPGVNEYGQLTTLVRDIDSGQEFDIDAMSSGEKGLILTFLLIGRTIAQDGIILIDEPELHLNPAVCKELLSFLIDQYVEKKSIQAIICSHSIEILTGAFGREQCTLYHLVSGTNLTRVRRQDREEITQALHRLGTSQSEELLYKGTIFVEGPDDVDLLEEGFGGILQKYKLKPLGGRNEVEKQIRLLQQAETDGEEIVPKFFIFDRDETPTDLSSTGRVKVLQWTKRCLENYLLDMDILTDLLQRPEIALQPVKNLAEVNSLFKNLAMEQLGDVVIRDVYRSFDFGDVNFRPTDVKSLPFKTAGEKFYERIGTLRGKISGLTPEKWSTEFQAACSERHDELQPEWDATWQNICDGKRLLFDFRRKFQLKISVGDFKRRVMSRMSRQPESDNWRAIESLLKNLLS